MDEVQIIGRILQSYVTAFMSIKPTIPKFEEFADILYATTAKIWREEDAVKQYSRGGKLYLGDFFNLKVYLKFNRFGKGKIDAELVVE